MSLDDNGNMPSKQQPQQPATSPRKHSKLIIISMLMLAALIAAVSVWYVNAQMRDTADVSIDSINGVPVKEDEVTIGDHGWTTWSPAYFVEGSGVPDDDLVSATIELGLQNVDNLRRWQLCEAELLAESKVSTDLAQANRDFPKNLPQNDDPAESAANATRLDREAQYYANAATLAATAGIPCTTGVKTNKLRTIIFEVNTKDGTRKMSVSDFDVLGSIQPLEYHVLTDNTVTQERARRAKTVEHEVDKTQVMYYYTEQSKAYDLATHDALIGLLTTDSATNR